MPCNTAQVVKEKDYSPQIEAFHLDKVKYFCPKL